MAVMKTIGRRQPAATSPLLQLESAHPRHLHVDDQAAGIVEPVRLQELVGAGEGLRRPSERAHQTGQGGANGTCHRR